AIGSPDGDPPNGPIYTFRGHTEEVYSLACSPIDSTLVATGGGDAKGFLWKIFHGDRASKLHGHTDSVSSLAFSYDGKFLASGSIDGIVQVWDVYGNLIRKFYDPKAGIEVKDIFLVTCGDFTPDGRIICTGSDDATLRIWNSENGENIHVVR
ncbi:vegetative incompatibility protein HET-E-1-like, partial [Trifolium medium]|nr:vegetative incompatibility protein HET-E-1-like [Trifolium medium]